MEQVSSQYNHREGGNTVHPRTDASRVLVAVEYEELAACKHIHELQLLNQRQPVQAADKQNIEFLLKVKFQLLACSLLYFLH